MTELQTSIEDRNRAAWLEWQLKRQHGFRYHDAWSPNARAYLEWAQGRKLEAARSFLDRLRYNRPK